LLNWAKRSHILEYNPLDCLSRRPESRDEKRRSLTDDECHRLLLAALTGSLRRATRSKSNRPRKDGTYKAIEFSPYELQRHHQEGRRIAISYALMLGTGLRVNEAKNLRWREVDLEKRKIYCRSEWTKNDQAAFFRFHLALLHHWLNGKLKPVLTRIRRLS
jgi:integrase